MYKDYELSVSPGVTASAPTEYIKTFPPSTIESVAVVFPKGPNREVFVKFMHEGESVFPLDPEEWINGEDQTVVVIGPWNNWDGLYQLRIWLCSPGARLTHKVIIRFNLSEVGSSGGIRNTVNNLLGSFLSFD